MREEIAVQNLKEIKEVFDRAGIKFWLDHGTLLGAVRDGKIIEWDTDIDLKTWYDNVDKIISVFPELGKKGFNVFLDFYFYKHSSIGIEKPGCNISVSLLRVSSDNAWTVGPSGDNLITKYVMPNLINVLSQRVCAAKPKGNLVAKVLKYCSSLLPLILKRCLCSMAWSIWKRSGGKYVAVVFPKHYFEKLETIEFYGMKFSIPSEVEKFLAYIYGTDWKTPKKEWDPAREDGTMIYPVEIGRFIKS